MDIKVIKSSGELVDYDSSKLESALVRAGVKKTDLPKIIEKIEEGLYNGISTKKIYQIAYKVLKSKSKNIAGKYRLKKAVLDLGPSGYPFEKFVGRLLERSGYEVQVDVTVPGKCVTHEIDVIGIKDGKKVYIECKFHKDSRKNDVKIPLYIHSRFLDVESVLREKYPDENFKFQGIIVTNTRFSEDAIAYAKCEGLKLIGWDYPSYDSLKDWIDRSGLHPITSLTSLTKKAKSFLLENDIVLLRELIESHQILQKIGLNTREINLALKEAKEIINYHED